MSECCGTPQCWDNESPAKKSFRAAKPAPIGAPWTSQSRTVSSTAAVAHAAGWLRTVGTSIGHSLPSAGKTATFFLSFFSYSLLVLITVDTVVANPRFKRFQVLSTRAQNFGLILLLTGATLQLIAAIQDFNS